VATDTFDVFEAYASGTASPGLSLFVAAHLALKPENQAIICEFEEIGGAILCESDPASCTCTMPADALDQTLAMLDSDMGAPEQRMGVVGACPYPGPVMAAVGCAFDEIPWRRRLRGVHEYVLSHFEGETVSLLRAQPGVCIPSHTHGGLEATLVVSGALQDGIRVMTAGDFSLCGEDVMHEPEIYGDEVCHCFVVREGAVRFKNALSALMRLI
jgi:putative transcriptional regulator